MVQDRIIVKTQDVQKGLELLRSKWQNHVRIISNTKEFAEVESVRIEMLKLDSSINSILDFLINSVSEDLPETKVGMIEAILIQTIQLMVRIIIIGGPDKAIATLGELSMQTFRSAIDLKIISSVTNPETGENIDLTKENPDEGKSGKVSSLH